MSDFSQNIQQFKQYGTYNYSFDSVGNLTFNSASNTFNQVYLAIPLSSSIYNNSKIESFFDVNFTEFVPTPIVQSEVDISASVDMLQQQLGNVQQQNANLQSQLSDLIVLNESSSSVASDMATQQVIIELRIALGQGRVSADFSPTFPYTPVNDATTTQST